MSEPESFDCWLIGGGILVAECGQTLLRRGHRIGAVITDDQEIREWAREHRIPWRENLDAAAAASGGRPDFLFSIANGVILTPGQIQVPRVSAINFHSSPLPRYAGVNQTCWAIYHGEADYAVSWHVIDPDIDTGDILLQQWFGLDRDETALSLNLKCHSAGVVSFARLVTGLESGDITPRKQDLSQRSYFARKDTLPHGGIVSWDSEAAQIERACRAADHGPFVNRLGVPKIVVGEHVFVLRRAAVVDRPKGAIGTVEVDGNGSVVVAATDRGVRIDELTTLDGTAVPPRSAIVASLERAGIAASPLSYLPAQILEQAADVARRSARHEDEWVDVLDGLQPVALPGIPDLTAADVQERQPISVDRRTKRVLSDTWAASAEIDVALSGWLAAITPRGQEGASVLWSTPTLRSVTDGVGMLFADAVPISVAVPRDATFAEFVALTADQRAAAERRGTFLRDLEARIPRASPRPPLQIAFSEEADRQDAPSADSLVTVFLGPRASWAVCANTAPDLASEVWWAASVVARRVQTIICAAAESPTLTLAQLCDMA
ncbi:methionyl-tRNA formyltransferase [Catenulispora sp. EB89]|uniref:formyltransferase family protein n=1 Tax=Catenulispora sp. EB89 TaxID=3156257 RepID=UPI00351276BF